MSDYRRTKGGDFNVNLCASFPATIFDEIEFLAQSHGLAKARVLRELALRGLAAYSRDGRLSEALSLPDAGLAAITSIDAGGLDKQGSLSIGGTA